MMWWDVEEMPDLADEELRGEPTEPTIRVPPIMIAVVVGVVVGVVLSLGGLL